MLSRATWASWIQERPQIQTIRDFMLLAVKRKKNKLLEPLKIDVYS